MKQTRNTTGSANITYIDTRKVAELANLTFTDEEHREIQDQLNEVLTYIRKLNAVDTSNIEPTAQVTGLKNRLRNDEPSDNMLSQDEALSGTDSMHNGLFKVEKLVDTTS